MASDYLVSVRKQFEYYKLLGEKTMEQLPEEKLFWRASGESNSIAVIIQHLHGNMLSRWTDFPSTDGEKETRNRDAEFEEVIKTKGELMTLWNDGWQCFFKALDELTEEDLAKTVYIRNMGLTVSDAINRQLAHYPYHIGQIVFIGKLVCNESWISLSIPKGSSGQFNAEKFAKPKHNEHFADEALKQKKG